MDNNFSERNLGSRDEVNGTAADSLAQSVFENPVEFLSALKTHFNKIDSDKYTKGLITADELKDYSEKGVDPEARAAAKIAFDHFDALQGMAAIPIPFMERNSVATHRNQHEFNRKLLPSITISDLNVDIDLFNGQVKKYTHPMQTGLVIQTAFASVATVGLGALTAATAYAAPPMAVFPGGLTAAFGYMAGSGFSELTTISPEIRGLANRNQKTLLGWPEINGGTSAQKR